MSEDRTKKLDEQSNGRFDELFQVVQAMRSELVDLKQTVDARLYDTRPIWEKVEADMAGLQEGQRGLSERMEALRDEMRTGFRNLKRQFSILNDTFLEVRADYKDLDNRVHKLETERT
jgi:chromosome segregation ATPase